ncbi:MAG: phosphate acyltransferase PlsX [Bacteroidota bacterium]|nr:phosphate acyltransferase PlsX [Bacteroidota bacterium]
MRIGLDVMGGDYAPKATVMGAILAINELSADEQIFLIGNKNEILSILEEENVSPEKFKIVHTSETIEMNEHPTKAFTQKPDSSIVIGFDMLKKKQIDSFASAGNTGAMLVGSIYCINAIEGIIRPCTSVSLPKENGSVGVMLDVGTNPDARPDVMYQFGILGSIYAEYVLNIKNPKVGLLNIGTEEEKGNILTQSTFKLMKDNKDFNFIGNIESRDLIKDKADVIVCDGFTGNIVLKQMESFYRIFKKRNFHDDYLEKFNYENIGGTPILGINSTVLIGHGISSPLAIKNMILQSRDISKAKLSGKIKKALRKFTQNTVQS